MAEKQTEVMSDRQQGQARQDNPQSQETKGSQTRQQERSDRQENQGRQQGQARQDQGRQDQGRQDQGRQENRMARRDQALLLSPFSLLQRFFNDDVLGAFDIFGTSRSSLASQNRPEAKSQSSAMTLWAPAVDVIQRGNELVIRADLPGVNADDVVVEVSDDAITISGERAQEQEEERGGVYRFERSYGAFTRVIPLPEGAMVDQAKANFKNGVLEITVPAPPDQVSRGRRLEIAKESEGKKEETSAQSRR
jgi:HSP20 family protein